MPAPKEIHDLVARFEANLDTYRGGGYNETLLRRDFLDPMFRALGWDMDNREGYAEAFRDVVHEDAIKVGGSTKAPDYSFRIGGRRIFFLEAKKPSVFIREEIAPAYQLRRYAWSADLPLSILSDFEEFAVYDCRPKPAPNDKPAKNRLLYLTFRDYLDRWDEIAAIFSKEAVLKGSFDRYAREAKGKRGTARVDNDFLAQIEGWREILAKNLALRNLGIDARALNFAVQATIDRIVFLRICEDRGIEPMNRLQGLTNGPGVYGRLGHVFREADDRYNSGLFHFRAERHRAGSPDEFTLGLKIDDKVLKELILGLYYPESPYEFSVLPADILGQVYERFLGSVIRLTAGGQARIEEKPEVKKAGGVYYTPTYIVDYIVGQTVGRLCDGKSPKEVAKLRILDPACGSGSFLIGAYQYLLDWHLKWYVGDDPERHGKGREPKVYRAANGWRLTAGERKRILTNNIHGVDIDAQAVEVTKLSLLLKVLEGETDETLNAQMRLFHERALPDLDGNIKCGNSLIGPDFYDGRLDLDADERRRINAFDWRAEFPEALKAGGFDAVIGNPPYIRIQTMKEWAPFEVEFYKERYVAARRGNYDIYVVFVERGLQLLNPKGRIGFILPHKFFNAQYGEALRQLISESQHLTEIVHFGHQQVFVGATTYTCLLFLSAQPSSLFRFSSVTSLDSWRDGDEAPFVELSPSDLSAGEWNFSVMPGRDLRARLESLPRLGDVARIFVGVQTSADDIFILSAEGAGSRYVHLLSKATGERLDLEKGGLLPLLSGTDVGRYSALPRRQYIIFPYRVRSGQAELIDFGSIEKQFPNIASYLLRNHARLSNRENGAFRDAAWHRFGRNQNIGLQGTRKICVPRMVDRLCASFDADGSFCLDNVDVGGVVLSIEHADTDLRYLLALLNSSLLQWYFPHVSAPFRGGWRSANKQFLAQLPIRLVDFTDKADLARHDRMVVLAEQMLDLHNRLSAAKAMHDKTLIERQIAATDKQIDRLVYELYGLTDDEIAIVEGSGVAVD